MYEKGIMYRMRKEGIMYRMRKEGITKARGIEFDLYLSEPHQSRNAHHEKYLKSRFNPTKI